ncbi:YbaB/EbfC family nucleoid-associated protein [Streptomyces lydicus]|uniref:YbaB/EbfC family nucleoid-associated protein n=1 Tax=Streptomyces lydicus TaxID=47763 RepID=UPI0036E8AF62
MDPFPELGGFADLGIEEMRAKFDSRMSELAAMQQQLLKLSESATSPQRLLTVTVGSQGEVTALKFHSDGYRTMARTELEHVLLETVQSARAKVMVQMKKLMTPLVPAGVDMDALMEGRVTPGDIMARGDFGPRKITSSVDLDDEEA